MTLSDLYRVMDTETHIVLLVEIQQEYHKAFVGKFYDCPVKYMEFEVKKINLQDGALPLIMVY